MDAVEQKTDCRNTTGSGGGGMMGFYSNLLTKNIAMGSSVEDAAISAYTAGSKRQLSLLEGNSSVPVNTHKQEIPSHIKGEKDVQKKEETVLEGSSNSVKAEEPPSKALKVSEYSEEIISPTHIVSIPQPTVPNIQSARERYLARMQASK